MNLNKKIAIELWNRGDYLGAGRAIFESIPKENRPAWATSVLSPLRKKYLPFKESDALFKIVSEPFEWKNARKVFEDIRNLFLKLGGVPELQYYIFDLAENVAKVIYNESGEMPTFDRNTGWRISVNLKNIIDNLPPEDELIRKEMESAFWGCEPERGKR